MCTLRNSQTGRLNFVFENWTNVFEPFPREEGSKQISHPVRRYSCNFWKAARSTDRPLFTDLCVFRPSSFLTIQGIQSSIYFQSTARYGLMSLLLDFFSLQAPRIFVIFITSLPNLFTVRDNFRLIGFRILEISVETVETRYSRGKLHKNLHQVLLLSKNLCQGLKDFKFSTLKFKNELASVS